MQRESGGTVRLFALDGHPAGEQRVPPVLFLMYRLLALSFLLVDHMSFPMRLPTTRSVVFLGLTLAVGVLLAGCSETETSNHSKQTSPAARSDGYTEADVAREITLRVTDERGLAEAIARHRGKVVLVDYWATWCMSCVELFPHTVELHRELSEQGLVVISVSFDAPEAESAVLAFLKKRGATFENFLSRYGAGMESFEKFNLPGTLPQFQIFDREGNLRHTFPAAQSAPDTEALDAAVRELLLSPGPLTGEASKP